MAANGRPGNRRLRLASVIVLGLLVLAVIGDVAYGAALLVTREPTPRPLTGDRIFHASRPAVVLVQGEYSVQASLPDADLGPGKLTDIENRLLAMVRSGQLPLDNNRIEQAYFDIIAGDPGAYLVPQTTRTTESIDLETSGTGFFVTENGYLVTASHVVSAVKDDLKAEVLDLDKQPNAMADFRDQLRKSIQSDAGFSVTDAQLDRLSTFFQDWEARYITLDKVDAKYYLASGASVEAGDHLTSTGIRASVVQAEPVYPDRDVALLKADVQSVPALRLATREPVTGATEFVVGYPRKGYLQEAAQFNATVPIVLSSGHIRGRIARSNWSAIGTDSDVTHGNSGGPVFDSKGDVLGVISFGTDPGGSAPSENYFVPSSVVKELMDKAGVKPNPGTATAAYYRALAEGDAKHYRHELPPLQVLADRMPDNTYVKDDIVAVQSATLGGQDRTPPDLVPYWPIAAGATGTVLALVLAVLVVRLLVGRRQPAPLGAPLGHVSDAPFIAEPIEASAPEPPAAPQSDIASPGGTPP
jgi:S1-C subfamily serine protease